MKYPIMILSFGEMSKMQNEKLGDYLIVKFLSYKNLNSWVCKILKIKKVENTKLW